MIRRTALGLVVTAALTIAFAAPALAGKGGGGSGGAATTSAWVAATPGSVSPGDRVYLSGCGYAFSPVEVRISHSAGYTQTLRIGMWSTGCLDTAYFTTAEAGTYRIDVYQQTSRKTTQLMASTSVFVG